MNEETAIEPVSEPKIIVSPELAKEAMRIYQEICQSTLIPWEERKVKNGVIIQESDYARLPIKRKDETGKWITEYKDFPRKSAWRKLARFYRISTEILEKERVDREDKSFIWHYTVKAIDPNGQYTTGEGSCDSREISGDRRREHDTKTKAHTRSKNRAISDLVGFGMVSAEEMSSTTKFVESEQTPPKEKPKAKVGPPPRKPKSKQRIDKTTVIYNLAASKLDETTITVFEEKNEIIVEPTKKLDEATQYKIDGILADFNAKWKKVGFYGRWIIKKKEK